jgi:hypothetical protein
MSKDVIPSDELSEFLLYTSPAGEVKVEIHLQNDTVWLTQQKMGGLFDTTKQNISYHLSNIFKDKELDKDSVVKDFLTTAVDGKQYKTKFYNLDAIISVGYRVNSNKATQFRIWATNTLKEYILKGFVLDDYRLKNGERYFGKDYFKELLERIRSIRTSERRIYQQITDIFAECSIDYDPKSEVTKTFFAMVQNKFHFAITGNTAAEIIYQQANSTISNMGLQTWKNAPDGRILKSDTTVAKNYLNEDQIKKLERTISGYFDYIENIVENRMTMTMKDLANSVDKFIDFNEYKVLDNKGSISKAIADSKAKAEYDKFNKHQPIVSDFDKEIKRLTNK